MTEPAAAGARLVLEGALILRNADATRETLRAAIDEPAFGSNTIAIDCSTATEADLTLVQLLIAARLSGEQTGKTVTLAASPDGPLLDTLRRGGFQVVRENAPDEPDAFWFQGADV